MTAMQPYRMYICTRDAGVRLRHRRGGSHVLRAPSAAGAVDAWVHAQRAVRGLLAPAGAVSVSPLHSRRGLSFPLAPSSLSLLCTARRLFAPANFSLVRLRHAPFSAVAASSPLAAHEQRMAANLETRPENLARHNRPRSVRRACAARGCAARHLLRAQCRAWDGVRAAATFYGRSTGHGTACAGPPVRRVALSGDARCRRFLCCRRGFASKRH